MNILVLLRHSSFWQNEIIYENYKSDGIVATKSVSCFRLISVIATELEIDQTIKNIDVRYIVDENTAPMMIRNENGVKVYIELKKICTDFVMYLLCITTSSKLNEDVEFDAQTGAIMSVEETESDAGAVAAVEANNQYSLYVLEIETTKFITDFQNTEVKVKQLYRDKKTLKAVMEKYALDHVLIFEHQDLIKKAIGWNVVMKSAVGT
ncbi:hypothetical protein P3S67_017783 [Capsicum chacoense]